MKWLFAFFLLLLMPFSARAAEKFDYEALGRMPVLSEGRIKPLDSLARVLAQRICGHSSCENRAPSEWLAFMMFTPGDAMQARMFTVSPQVVRMLGLSENSDNRYSFKDIAAILPANSAFIKNLSGKDKNTLSGDEAEVVRLYSAMNDFAEIIGTFSLFSPLPVADSARTALHIPASAQNDYFDLHSYRQKLTEILAPVVKRKGTALDNYTPEEIALTQLGSQLSLREDADGGNALVRIIPPVWGGQEWLSPWGVLSSSGGSPHSAALLRHWQAVAQSYRDHNPPIWNQTTQALLKESLATLPPSFVWRLLLEYNYHRLMLLPMAAGCYGIGILVLVASVFPRCAKLLPIGNAGLLVGMILHGTAIVMRMLILMRPPVSTLYESLVFVSFIVMAASCYLGWHRRNIWALLTGAFTSLSLLLASWIFAGDSDTLGVLVAVLNTNFWLATHVVCITTGYGCALMAGAIAHIYLFRSAVTKIPEAQLIPLGTLLHRTALVALLFTSVGTMLGGIWADQSWGRFWGWDPKENGALLIVLWLVWLLHGRIAKQLSAFGFAALMALINVVVAVAWIGVNLLSVGLHSYGFTDTAATGLLAFCALEFTYVSAMMGCQRIVSG